jgi:hypothetical protein
MITTTEDRFDVNYDFFSIAGRAALFGGAAVALDKSIKHGHFKTGRGKLRKENNKFIKNLSSLMNKDVAQAVEDQKPIDSLLKNTDLYTYTDTEKAVSKRRNFAAINNINDEIIMSGGSKAGGGIADFLDGGYRNQSATLMDELKALQVTIDQADNSVEGLASGRKRGRSSAISVNFDSTGQITSIGIPSKAGKIKVHTVNKEGMVTMGSAGQNQSVIRGVFNSNSTGTGIGEIVGADVAYVRGIRENYSKFISGEMNLDEYNNRFMELMQYNDKATGFMNTSKMNPEAIALHRHSAKANPFQPMSEFDKKQILKNEALDGRNAGNASDVNKGIIYLKGNVIEQKPFAKEASNSKQGLRTNTSHIDSKGNHSFNHNQEVLFMDEKGITRINEYLAEEGKSFGHLGKEELLTNRQLAGTLVDNTRSLQIHAGKETDLSRFLMGRMSDAAGLSEKDFAAKLKQGGGFQAFSPEVRAKLTKINVDDYHEYLKKAIEDSKNKRQAYLKVNSNSAGVISGPVGEQIYFADAERLKGQGSLSSEIEKIEKEIITREEQFRNRNLLGISRDGQRKVQLEKEHRGLYLDDIHISENEGLTYGFRKQRLLDQGDKIHDIAGEVKATVKRSIDGLEKYILRYYQELNGNKPLDPEVIRRIKNVEVIANSSAMKSGLDPRNLSSMFHSIRHEARQRITYGASKMSDAENNKWAAIYEAGEDLLSNFERIDDTEKMNYFKRIETIIGGKDEFEEISGLRSNVGFFKNKDVAFGNAAIDTGAGGLGFFSERHIGLYSVMGLDAFAEDVMSRRLDPGANARLNSFEASHRMMKDITNPTKAGIINPEKLQGGDFNSNVFPLDVEGEKLGSNSVLKQRAAYLSNEAIDGVAYVDLEDEILGYRKIGIFTDPSMKGHIGEKIGHGGKYKKYTELDTITKDIISEMGKPKLERNKERLTTLVTNYDSAISQMRDDLRSKIFKGKVTSSMNAQVSSGSNALEEYADSLAAKFKTKNAQPFVVAVNKNKFIEMYGEDAYDAFHKKTGANRFSDTWAVAVREPVEGLSAITVNVVPSDSIEGLEALSDERMAIASGKKNNILRMVYGDYDGDTMSLIAAKTEAAANEVKERAYGNTEDSIELRKAQEIKTRYTLKGREAASVLTNDLAEMRLSTFLAKDLEKGFIGIASNSASPLHQMNAMLNNGDIKKFARVENTLHLFAENIIKGKAQSTEDLISGRAKKVLDSITGDGEFGSKHITEKIKTFRDFSDELFLSLNEKSTVNLGDKIRAGETSEEIEAIFSREGGVSKKDFLYLTSDEAVTDLMEVSNLAGEYKGGMNAADQARELNRILEGSKVKQSEFVKTIMDNTDDVKAMSKGFGGNLAKYALAPAAILGLLGTVFGARSSIEADVEFGDMQSGHNKSNGVGFSPPGAPNIKSPRHMKPSISGNARTGFQINKYAAEHNTSSMRIKDDTRNFDYHDMQDKIGRGY